MFSRHLPALLACQVISLERIFMPGQLLGEGAGYLVTIVLCVLALIGVYYLFDHTRRISKRRWFAANDVKDATNQLRFVMAASFRKKKVMSSDEYRVFRVVEEQVRVHRRGYRVMSQTSLGEIINSNDRRAFQSINSKRADILIVAPSGYPVGVLEVQGAGHHQRDAAARDAVKREALRKAGVEYAEILEDHSSASIAQIVREMLSRTEGMRPERSPPRSAA
jgi:hypothetical protein